VGRQIRTWEGGIKIRIHDLDPAISAPSGTSRHPLVHRKTLLYFRVARSPLLPWWASLLAARLARAPGASAITNRVAVAGDLPNAPYFLCPRS